MNVYTATIILFLSFALLLAIGVPISVSILISSMITAVFSLPINQVVFITLQNMNSGIESFSLLAIPLFLLAGNIMKSGGIAQRLINFAQTLAGRIPGSLAHTNVLGNMLFGALSGSAVAAAAAIGGTMNPVQIEEGYDPAFSTAVNIASAPTGLLIPPTSAVIVYSTVSGGVSISALFMAGYVPGLMMGLATMFIAYLYAKKHNYVASSTGTTGKEKLKAFLDALPSLFMIVVVIGGIVGGMFTATEGAGVAVLYCFVLSLIYRQLSLERMKNVLLETARTSGIILFLISASSAMSWVMAFSGIPGAISDAMLAVTDNRFIVFLLVVIILLIVGMFMDVTPSILIFTPIFLPLVQELGMDPVQFGIILIFTKCIGAMTPPVGSVLFVACGITDTTIEEVTKPLLPMLGALTIMLLLVTYIPFLSLGLPELLGLL